MTNQTAWLERRNYERVESRLKVRYRSVAVAEVDQLMESRLYKDIIEYAGGERSQRDSWNQVMNTVTENISAGGMQLLLDAPMKQGQTLAVEVELRGVPHPIQTLAVAVRDSSEPLDGKHAIGLRFLGISREDISKVEQYVANLKGSGSGSRELVAA